MFNIFWELLMVLLLIALVMAVIFGVIGAFQMVWETNYCKTQSQLMPQLEFQWQLWGGCLIHLPDGTWAHAHDYLNQERMKVDLNEQ